MITGSSAAECVGRSTFSTSMPVHAGHHDVEEHEVHALALHDVEGRGPVGGHEDGEAALLEAAGQHVQVGLVVVDHEQRLARVRLRDFRSGRFHDGAASILAPCFRRARLRLSDRPGGSGWAGRGPGVGASAREAADDLREVDAGLDAHAVEHVEQVLGREVAAGARARRGSRRDRRPSCPRSRSPRAAPPGRSRARCRACRGSGRPAPRRGSASRRRAHHVASPASAPRRRSCRRSRPRAQPASISRRATSTTFAGTTGPS